MALSLGAQGTYTDVTGIVNSTAAAQIVVLVATLKGLIETADGEAGSNPDFNMIPRHVQEKIVDEIDALAVAIAAAPTA